jgi:hypothetical protein
MRSDIRTKIKRRCWAFKREVDWFVHKKVCYICDEEFHNGGFSTPLCLDCFVAAVDARKKRNNKNEDYK